MAYGEELMGESPLAYTIHVWPTSELVAQSWSWPERRRQAYELVAGVLGLAVVMQILDAGALPEDEIEMPTSLGRVTFTISQAGTTIHIAISEFTAPDRPGPNGGARQQPTPIDGLVLGLRGSDRYFHLVVFHGVLPSLPADNILPSSKHRYIPCNVDRTSLVARISQLLSAIGYLEQIPQLAWCEFVLDFVDDGCADAREDAQERANMGVDIGLSAPPNGPFSRDCKIRLVQSAGTGGKEMEGFGPFSFKSAIELWSCDLPRLLEIYSQLGQRQSDHIRGRYLH